MIIIIWNLIHIEIRTLNIVREKTALKTTSFLFIYVLDCESFEQISEQWIVPHNKRMDAKERRENIHSKALLSVCYWV